MVFMQKKTRKNNKIKGGAAIAAGGFGCVFKPALKCKKNTVRHDGVSKVLITKYANDEMAEIHKIKSIINKIPNYNEYFIGLDATACELDSLTANDLIKFDIKCENLIKKGIRASNINSNLDKVKSINLPYGGLELQTFLSEKKLNSDNFVKLNNALIKLLKNGVVPMNKLKLFHFDLKGSNILINDDFKASVIDWGLSGIQKNNEIPDIVKSRPFMFNMPFSICLFDNEFKPFIKFYIENTLTSLALTKPVSLNEIRQEIKLFMIKWIYEFMDKGGKGHYDYISSMIKKLLFTDIANFPERITLDNVDHTKLNEIITIEFENEYIVDELTEIVIQYTNLNGTFNDEAYFNNAFKHNADVWGFLTCYTDDLIRVLLDYDANYLTYTQSVELLYAIKNIAHKYMFNAKHAIHSIDIDALARDLKQLNYIVGGSLHSHGIISITPPSINKSFLSNHHVINIPPTPPTPPHIIVISSSKSKSRSKSKSKQTEPKQIVKKSRKQRVTCDEPKKIRCRTIGKICNELTGRCNNPKK
jgi:hypothetical protein